jgi:hypothetical protein
VIFGVVRSHPGAIAEARNLSKRKFSVIWQAEMHTVFGIGYLLAIESVRGIVGALVLAADKANLQPNQSKRG